MLQLLRGWPCGMWRRGAGAGAGRRGTWPSGRPSCTRIETPAAPWPCLSSGQVPVPDRTQSHCLDCAVWCASCRSSHSICQGRALFQADKRQDRAASRHKKGVDCVRANACDFCGVFVCHSSSGEQQMAVEPWLLWAERRQQRCARSGGIIRCGAACSQRRSSCAAVGQCGRNSRLRCRAGSDEAVERPGGEQPLPSVPDYQDGDREASLSFAAKLIKLPEFASPLCEAAQEVGTPEQQQAALSFLHTEQFSYSTSRAAQLDVQDCDRGGGSDGILHHCRQSPLAWTHWTQSTSSPTGEPDPGSMQSLSRSGTHASHLLSTASA